MCDPHEYYGAWKVGSARWSAKVNPVTAAAVNALGRFLCRSVEKFVFVASTGRCGTSTLDRLFRVVPGCVSFHEPYPVLHGEAMIACNNGEPRHMEQAFHLRKLPHIYRAAARKKWYVETNHVFIKCFADVAAAAFASRMYVIHLTRNPNEVAASFLRTKGSIPGTQMGNNWCLDYLAERNKIQMAEHLSEGGRFSHPFYRCLWYWYETEARTAVFKDSHPDIPVHDLELAQLNTRTGATELLSALGMPVTEAVLSRVGARENTSPKRPDIPECIRESELEEFHALCQGHLKTVAMPGASDIA